MRKLDFVGFLGWLFAKKEEKVDGKKNKLIYSGQAVSVADEQKAVDDVMPIFWATIDSWEKAKRARRYPR